MMNSSTEEQQSMEKMVSACFKVPEQDYRKLRAWVGKEGWHLQDALRAGFKLFAKEKGIAISDDTRNEERK